MKIVVGLLDLRRPRLVQVVSGAALAVPALVAELQRGVEDDGERGSRWVGF